MTPKKKPPHKVSDGYYDATVSLGVFEDAKMRQVLDNYRKLNTDEARAAFALKWSQLIADRFDRTWPVLYEMLRLIKAKQLYKDKSACDVIGIGASESFEGFFEEVMGKPFSTWFALETTYHFATESCPELLKLPFGEAVSKYQEMVENLPPQPTKADAMMGNQNACKVKAVTENSSDNVRTVSEFGNKAEYLIRRLKRDAPEIAKALARGEYKSARAAAIAAGIVHPPTPYQILCRAWNKASKEEIDRFMTEKRMRRVDDHA